MLPAMLAYERGLRRIYPRRAKRDVPNRAASRAADGPRRSARVCVAAPLLLTWAFTACVNSDVALHVVFDVPNGPLDPAQATTVDLVLHHSDGTSLSRTAQLKGGSLDFGTLPLDEAGAISATFRAAGAAMVGYGRVATPVRIRDGGEVAIPIRRPMVYLAAATQAADGDPATSDPWALAKSVVADLSPGAGDLDGQLRLDVQATDFVSVGPHLYAVEQPLLADGQLAGALSLVRFAATNHAVAERFTVPVVGAVRISAAFAAECLVRAVGIDVDLFPGALGPVARSEECGDAVFGQDIGRHLEVLAGGAAGEEKDLVVGGHFTHGPRRGLGLVKDLVKDLAAVAQFHDADAAAPDAPEFLLGLAQHFLGEHAGAGAEVVHAPKAGAGERETVLGKHAGKGVTGFGCAHGELLARQFERTNGPRARPTEQAVEAIVLAGLLFDIEGRTWYTAHVSRGMEKFPWFLAHASTSCRICFSAPELSVHLQLALPLPRL